jgi:hypothetical protein
MTLAEIDAKILRDAKVLIEQRGWRSGLTQDNNSGGFPKFEYQISAYDAIVKAGGIIAGRAVDIMRATVAPTNPRSLGIIDWNDAHGRTLDQVYAGFDRAIATAEAQEKAQ